MAELPAGVVTFLFTDIEGSAPLFQEYPDAMKHALARHHAILQSALAAHQGHVFQIIGDAFCVAFAAAADAVNAALDAQRALYAESWGETGALRVRMGLHTGVAETRADTYVSSLTLVRVQRVMSAGHGGQVLLSGASAEQVRSHLPEGATLRELGAQKLRGLAQPEPIYQLVAPDLPSEFPPLRVTEMSVAHESAAPLGQLVRGTLVGRRAELEQLQQHWALAQQARGHMVMVSGEPGVGKTRLAQELVVSVQKEGAVILRGGCYEYEATTPYLPFIEAFRDWVHWQSADILRATLGATAPEIAKFAPEIENKLGALVPNAPLPPNEERLRLFDNIARFLQALAAARGLLVFIDDVHWVDQGTLSILHYLLRHLRNDRVLILAAYREVELDRAHPLAAALVDWNREHVVTRVSLDRFTRLDTGALLATLLGLASISDEFVDVMYRETEGNPFFIEEVVKSLVDQGQIYLEAGRWQWKELHELAIPQSVKEAIGRRLNHLGETTIDVLHTAAALGKIFPFCELAAVASIPEDQLLDALDEASAAQLLHANTDDTFAFTHDKIREVLYEELNPIRRRRLHQRIGESLEKLYALTPDASLPVGEGTEANGHSADLAYHFAQSNDLQKSLTYSLQAAENAERIFAHDEALKFYEQARECAEALNQAVQLAAIHEAMGDVYDQRGTIQLAVQSYERALAMSTAPEVRAALKAKIGNALTPIDDPRGLAYLTQAVEELNPQTQTNILALATGLIGRYHHYRAEHSRAIEFLQRARQLAEPGDDAYTLSLIYTYLAGAYQHGLRYAESDQWARASIALGERKHDPQAEATGYEFLAENAFGQGYWDDTLGYAARDYAIGEKIGSLARLAWGGFCRATAYYGQGELNAALTATQAALDLSETMGEARLATWLYPQLALVSSDLGDDTLALESAERGYTLAQTIRQLVLTAWAQHARGYYHLQREEWAQALQWYEPYVELVRESENRVSQNLIRARAAEAFLCAGRVDEAAQLIVQCLALAQFGQTPHYKALALRVQGQVFVEQGALGDAQRAYGEAIVIFEKLGSRLELGRAFYHRARLWQTRDDRTAAHADARRARDIFSASGARRDLARAEKV